MSYAKEIKKDTAYTAVNHLIQSKKYSGISIMPPYAAAIQTKSTEDSNEPLTAAPGSEVAARPEVEQSNALISEDVVTPGETTASETEAASTGSVTPADQQAEPPAEAAATKGESFVPNESEIDEGQKEDQDETKSDQQSGTVQKKGIAAAATGAAAPIDPNLGRKINYLASQQRGETLQADIQYKMGHAVGMDFKNVRVYHDAQTAAMATNLGAKAFTEGENIYFNQGEYNPDTTAGQHLIAHELTHVKQQRTIPGLQYKLQEPTERDRYEQEADVMADRVVGASTPTQIRASSTPDGSGLIKSAAGVQCKDEGGAGWILRKVGELLRNIPGYDILTLIIGRDPITGQEVKRDGFAFVKAIVGLIPGGKMIFENLEKTKIIPKAWNWFKEEFKKLNLSFATIKQLFSQTWDSLSFWDLASPGKAFNKIKNIFTAPVKRIMNFIAAAGSNMAEFIFEGALTLVGAPVNMIMGVLNKGKNVLRQIFNDPVGFLKNLVNAVKGGLGKFVGNIKTHLQNGIGGWLFGTLGKAGLVMPEKLNLAGIFSIVAQVLGVTWKAIRTMVVKRLGSTGEKVMGQVEKSVAFVGKLITKGPLALLEMAQELIGELPGMFFGSLIEWVRNTIIVKAIQQLISMFNPVGAIIQAVITIYNVVQFFIERAKQIAAFVGAIFNSIAEIAGGNIGKAIAAVENALAKGLPVAISFLAGMVGLRNIATKIKDIIQTVRKPIEKVVGKVVGFVVGKAKTLIAKLTGGDRKKEEPPKNQAEHDAQVKAGLAALDQEQKQRDVDHNNALTFKQADEAAQKVKAAYPVFKSITPVEKGDRWVFEYVASKGEHKGLNVESSASYGLPRYDGKTTHGVLVISNGERIAFVSGNANPKYSNYIPASHVEGKSAIYMRENGIEKGTVYHNNTDGTCPYCDRMLQTLLEKDSVLEVIPPKEAKAPKPSWVDKPKIYVGNEKFPKQNI